MANILLCTTNISLYTIPIAWLTCIGPHIHAIKLYEHLTGAPSRDSSHFKPEANAPESASGSTPGEVEDYRFDKTQPRTFISLIKRNNHPAMTPGVKARLARMEAASWNGYESLGLFCSAVVAANLGIVSLFVRPGNGSLTEKGSYVWWMNVSSIGYVVCRVMFNLYYEYGFSGLARGGWFYAGVGCCFSMVVRAASVLRTI